MRYLAELMAAITLLGVIGAEAAETPGTMAGRPLLFEDDSLEESPLGLVAEFSLDGKEAAWAWLLVAEGAAAAGDAEPVRVLLNGERYEVDPSPLPQGAGLAWQVPAGLLREGDNTITYMDSQGGRPPNTMAGYALLDGAEEAHLLGWMMERQAQPPTHPAQDQVDMLHIDLAMTLDPGSRLITEGQALYRFRLREDGVQQLVLDMDTNGGQMGVSQVLAVNGKAFTGTFTADAGRVYIPLPQPNRAGNETTVELAFAGTPRSVNGGGYLRTTHGNNVPLIYTNSQPYYARTWWPCIDVPADKFTLDFEVTVPTISYSGYPWFPVSNGALEEVADNGNGTTTYHWASRYNIATYLVSLAVTNFRSSSADYTALDGETTMEVAHYVWPQSYASQANEAPNTVVVLQAFAEMFGEYPFLEEKYWTAAWGLSYGMEHQTATSMPDPSRTSAGGTLDFPFSRRNVHEAAHMWFGDKVTLGNYDHLWLNEGWATYCEALFYEWQATRESGEAAGRETYHAYVNGWSTSDTVPIVSEDADDFILSITYRKGAWVLHMLRRVIGDEAFFNGARLYLQRHAYDVALSDDLQSAFEETSGRDLSRFFEQWLYQAERPSYDWVWRTDGPDVVVDVLQTQAEDPYEMPIELDLLLAGGERQRVVAENTQRLQTFRFQPEGTVTGVAFDPDNWLLETNRQATQQPAPAPTLLSVLYDEDAGEAVLAWEPVFSLGLEGFEVRRYEYDEEGIPQLAGVLGADGLDPTATSARMEVPAGERSIFTVATVPGETSSTYEIRAGAANQPRVLLVDGADRWDRERGTHHSHVWLSLSQALGEYPAIIETCTNEAIGTGVDLLDYEAVLWMLGEESTADETFSTAEQGLVEAYLIGGGSLFVSGNEVGWDLQWRGSSEDTAFYNNFLRADYLVDDTEIYIVQGTGPGTIFGEQTYSYGGEASLYRPDWPDGIAPLGSEAVLAYPGSPWAAGVYYEGPFAPGAPNGRVLYTAFAFETIDTPEQRADFLRRAMEELLPAEPSPEHWMIY